MRSILYSFLLATISFSQTYAASLNEILPDPYPEIYQNIEVLPFNNHGWYGFEKIFANLIAKYKVKTVIEVGSWMGCSTRSIAAKLPKDGKVYAVDHWLGSEEHEIDPTCREMLPTLYQQFLSNVIHAGLTQKIIPVRMPSLLAAEKLRLLNVQPDLIYIDAGHDFVSVYNDITAWYPYVRGKCIFCGDDYGWPGVRRAVRKFAKERHLKVHTEGSFWMLKKN